MHEAFGSRVDFATIRKLLKDGEKSPDHKFQTQELKGNRRKAVLGNPDPEKITTTSIEGFFTRLRAWNTRFFRDSIKFGRDEENTRASIALCMMFANFCRIPRTMKVSPAMELGVTDTLWDADELIKRVDVEREREVGYLTSGKSTSRR